MVVYLNPFDVLWEILPYVSPVRTNSYVGVTWDFKVIFSHTSYLVRFESRASQSVVSSIQLDVSNVLWTCCNVSKRLHLVLCVPTNASVEKLCDRLDASREKGGDGDEVIWWSASESEPSRLDGRVGHPLRGHGTSFNCSKISSIEMLLNFHALSGSGSGVVKSLRKPKIPLRKCVYSEARRKLIRDDGTLPRLVRITTITFAKYLFSHINYILLFIIRPPLSLCCC